MTDTNALAERIGAIAREIEQTSGPCYTAKEILLVVTGALYLGDQKGLACLLDQAATVARDGLQTIHRHVASERN